jgi:hypothetical protein
MISYNVDQGILQSFSITFAGIEFSYQGSAYILRFNHLSFSAAKEHGHIEAMDILINDYKLLEEVDHIPREKALKEEDARKILSRVEELLLHIEHIGLIKE